MMAKKVKSSSAKTLKRPLKVKAAVVGKNTDGRTPSKLKNSKSSSTKGSKTSVGPKLVAKVEVKAKVKSQTKSQTKSVSAGRVSSIKPAHKSNRSTATSGVSGAQSENSVSSVTPISAASEKKASKISVSSKSAVDVAVSGAQRNHSPQENIIASPSVAQPVNLKVLTRASAEEDASEKAGEKKKKKDELKFDRSGDLAQQWQLLFEKFKSLPAPPYVMSENYEARGALVHKVLGWGFVITSQNNRLEVLFKDGIKVLISNYKG
jgi:hypothetical protein